MQELVIASNNQGKIQEIRSMIADLNLLSLSDIGFHEEIEEPFDSFEQNALAKAQTVYRFCGKNTLADDSGICVSALAGAPGVHSAYFGGLPRSDERNNQALLSALEQVTDRTAFYKAVICLIWDGKHYFFEGICNGNIQYEPSGSNGFGYDPLFVPDGYQESFAALPAAVKNSISHRGIAIRKAVDFLKQQLGEL